MTVYYLNNKGEVLWSKHFETINQNNVYDLVVTSDGNLAVGMTAEVNAGIQGPVITKMNLKGDVLWSKGYYFASVKDTAAELTPL